MTRRILPPEEWDRLNGTELEAVWPHLDPARSVVLVIEEADQIIGCWSFFWQLHAEGVYIAPEYRKQGHVARLLIRGMREVADEQHARTLATSALSEDVAQFAQRLGAVPLPGTHFVITMEELCRPRSQYHS